MTTMSAADRIASLFETFQKIPIPPHDPDPIGFPGYLEERQRAQDSTGDSEAVVAGIGTIGSHQVAAAVFDFRFLGGSLSVGGGSAIESAISQALDRRIPFVAVTSSGGARMQEGMAALAQMPRTVAASAALASAGVPRITLLTHPTTGGVYASFGALADFLIAEEGATIGFAGPRVAKALSGTDLPPGSHTAEEALRRGLIDTVVGRRHLKETLTTLLDIVSPNPSIERPVQNDRESRATPSRPPRRPWRPSSESAWDEYAMARHPGRPTPRYYVEDVSDGRFELLGDRAGHEDPAVGAFVATLSGRSVCLVVIDRRRPTAGGFRKAVRAIRLAERLGLPIVTLVDTPGADPGFDSEYGGLAAAISSTFEAILSAKVPVVCLTTGEGGSGGALALSCGDVVGIQEHAVFSVIAPEGAAEILHRDQSRAAELAPLLKPTSSDLVGLGIADEIVAEPEGGAHLDPAAASRLVGDWLRVALDRARSDPQGRAARFRILRTSSKAIEKP